MVSQVGTPTVETLLVTPIKTLRAAPGKAAGQPGPYLPGPA
jgi:hypothetical protein